MLMLGKVGEGEIAVVLEMVELIGRRCTEAILEVVEMVVMEVVEELGVVTAVEGGEGAAEDVEVLVDAVRVVVDKEMLVVGRGQFAGTLD